MKMGDVQIPLKVPTSFYLSVSTSIDGAARETLPPATSNGHLLSFLKSPLKCFKSKAKSRTKKASDYRRKWLFCRSEAVEDGYDDDDNCGSCSLSEVSLGCRTPINRGDDHGSQSTPCQESEIISPSSVALCKKMCSEEDEDQEKSDSVQSYNNNEDFKNDLMNFTEEIVEDAYEKEVNLDFIDSAIVIRSLSTIKDEAMDEVETNGLGGEDLLTSLRRSASDDSKVEVDGSQHFSARHDLQVGSENPKPRMQLSKKMEKSKGESRDDVGRYLFMKLAQRIPATNPVSLFMSRFNTMLSVIGNTRNPLPMLSGRRLKRRRSVSLLLALHVNLKTKKTVANTSDEVCNGEELWRKKILMGRRCVPLEMEDGREQHPSMATKVAAFVTDEDVSLDDQNDEVLW